MDLSNYDATFPTLSLAPELRKAAMHPVVFGLAVGGANGLLVMARNKKLTARGALATAAVLAVGEAILSMDETQEQRGGRPAAWIGALSGFGVLTGLALFTDWRQWAAGDRPVLIVQATPAPGLEPVTAVA